jgi:hypothetical protein
MKVSDLEKIASEDGIIKLANAIRLGFSKLAEEADPETKQEDVEVAVAETPVVPTTQNVNRSADLQGKTDEIQQPDQPTVDKKELEAAITEAISTMNVGGLGKIIASLKETVGDEVASNAISIARQVMQDLVVSGQLDKEQVAGLAQAFVAAEE